MFISLSSDDFLSPGFIVNGILLQGVHVDPQEYVSAPFQIIDMKPVTFLISTSESPIAFDIQVEGPQGMAYHNSNLIESSFTFTPDSKGNYVVTIKNLSGKPTIINISSGFMKSYEINHVLLVILSIGMIIGGNYFIVHNYFSSLRNYS